MSGEPRRILFVCTANRCRSPAAERLAARRVAEDRALFRSAGFLDAGRPCPAPLVEALAERGVEAGGHRSHRLDPDTLEAAELVLTMEGEHVQRVVAAHRPAYARTLPLREAAAVARRAVGTGAGAGGLGIEGLVALANRDRSPVAYLGTGWDVADPHGGRLSGYRRAVAEIEGLIDTVLAAIL